MSLSILLYQVDAFTDQLFGGNPAAVCPLAAPLPPGLCQAIALENHLSETAFLWPDGTGGYHIRWFTPTQEVDLCGHATLAAAYVVGEFVEPGCDQVRFQSRQETLTVRKQGDLWELDFPRWPLTPAEPTAPLIAGLGLTPQAVCRSPRDIVAVVADPEVVKHLQPDYAQLAQLDCLGVIVTAEGRGVDFVSRFFAPQAGIPEDPVTGSAHCALVPYWGERLGKTELHARQLSPRGGELWCTLTPERVLIRGGAVCYLTGQIHLGEPMTPIPQQM
ncbi:PhzF family phenazine biosynthesis protein [Synechococcus sp. C9]|uniref:PhzF family phenazine biosynthesis protein n=1 Tax=Synechococcus sp. C9 TaxID=102119 RepID=UPI001FF54160|nr:PhzF family phenazine biosynthesis protein [Synechococcus sp. C9]